MMELSFQDRLAELRATNCEQLPTPQLAILTKTITRLRKLGLRDHCLQVGETAPDFEFIDGSNEVCRFYDSLQSGPVVLNFFRGYWCPFCRTELEAYQSVQDQLNQLGCAYFAVSPQKPQKEATPPTSYQSIFDKDNRIANQFGIVYSLDDAEKSLFQSWGLQLDQVNATDTWQLPVPATFIVCPDRRIGYAYVDVDFRSRCCPDQLIEELKSFCNC